jgi:hypothetical protein
MPNWCSNHMTIIGPEAEVRSILSAIRPELDDEDSGLRKFMPQPKDENGELVGGTSWQYDNWGTKWGDCDTDITYEDYDGDNSSASLVYSTAWGPMSGLVAEISRLHPQCTIDVEYEEPGMCFFGIEQYRNGSVVLDRHHEYEFDSGVIKLPDGWEMNFDTDWDDEEQDPMGTLNDAIHAACEHMWTQDSLAGKLAPSD